MNDALSPDADTQGMQEPVGDLRPRPEKSTTAPDWGSLTDLTLIGRGASGDVYLASDRLLKRPVALKLFPTGQANVEEFALREARLLAQVHHPNVVTVYGLERNNGRAGIWMEYIRGCTLADLVRERGPVGPTEAAEMGASVCRALAAVHRAGVLHRDVKAQNIMREDDGRIVLMDFSVGRSRDGKSSLTRGGLVGTPSYLAPEVLMGQPASVASDVYSVGALLFYLVTGEFPETPGILMDFVSGRAGWRTRPLNSVRADLPAPFCAAVERALVTDPTARYGSADELANALDTFNSRGRTLAPPAVAEPARSFRQTDSPSAPSILRRVWLLLVVAVVILVAALVWFRQRG